MHACKESIETVAKLLSRDHLSDVNRCWQTNWHNDKKSFSRVFFSVHRRVPFQFWKIFLCCCYTRNVEQSLWKAVFVIRWRNCLVLQIISEWHLKKKKWKNTFQHDLNASWGDLGVEWDLGNKFGFSRFCPMDILGFIQGRRHLSFLMKIPKRFSSILKIFSGLEVPIFRLGILSANFLNFFQTFLNFQTLSSAHNKGHTTQMFHYHNH